MNSEGLYEQHITADIALAQWQYYLVTGDRGWLATQGWPVLSGAATFWASRATLGSEWSYHIDGVTGPDEENPNVNDEVYTNVGAMRTLQDAVQAAHVLGITPPASWSRIAAGLVVPVNRQLNMHPEFSGYGGQLVKQADVTMLQYPWNYTMPSKLAQGDLDYYVPRSDPGGPSMDDADQPDRHRVTRARPGCSAYVYTERSYQPFIRDVFHQFSETRTGGAFTFMTGIGGFLQEFLYGYSGMRWNSANVGLDPTLNSQIGGIVLHAVQWRGRVFQIAIGPQRTTVTLLERSAASGRRRRAGLRTVRRGHPLTLATRRPDLTATGDLVRCGRVAATQLGPGRAGARRGRRQPGHRLAAGNGTCLTDRAAAGRWPARSARSHCGGVVSGPPCPVRTFRRPPGLSSCSGRRATRFRCRTTDTRGGRWPSCAAGPECSTPCTSSTP